MTPHPVPNPGGKERKEDPRDYTLKLGSVAPAPAIFMQDKAFSMPIFYQRQQPSCGANAGAWIAGFLNGQAKRTPRYQWVDIKSFDGIPISDGTTMDAIFKSVDKGSLEFDVLGDDTALSLTRYAAKSAVTSSMKTQAAKNTMGVYGFHNEALTFSTLKSLIYQYGAIVLLVRIGDEWWTDKKGNSSWAEKDILPLRTPSSVVSGHFVVAHSYDANYIYFENHWSTDWGRNGHGYFGENYLPQIVEVGTIVDSPDQVNIPVFTKDLYLGVTDPQVKLLQQYLNTHGFPVALSGVGSAGNETDYFGSLTQKALIAFQKAKGIVPASGYFGPITRNFIAK